LRYIHSGAEIQRAALAPKSTQIGVRNPLFMTILIQNSFDFIALREKVKG
jgi:hypothetical protein